LADEQIAALTPPPIDDSAPARLEDADRPVSRA
jgi:hypothetical protein